MNRLATRWLPPARIMHSWPSVRFDARTQGMSPVRQFRSLGSARGAAPPVRAAVPIATAPFGKRTTEKGPHGHFVDASLHSGSGLEDRLSLSPPSSPAMSHQCALR